MSGKMDKPKIVMPGHFQFFGIFQEFWLQSLKNGFEIVSILVIKNFYNCFVTFLNLKIKIVNKTEQMEKGKKGDARTKIYVYSCPNLFVWFDNFFFYKSLKRFN